MKTPDHNNRQRHAPNDRRALQIEMTPMIDVVFLLLVFFLWTASFRLMEERLPTAVAESDAVAGSGSDDTVTEELDFERIVVRLLWDNKRVRMLVNGTPQPDLEAVARQLHAISTIRNDLPVVVDPAPEVPLGTVIDVYDATRQAGLEQIQFAAGDST